jgi:hypothetical protein
VNPLTPAQYDVIQALVEAGDAGLFFNALMDRSGHSHPHKILGRLTNTRPEWRHIIRFPGTSWRGYRLGNCHPAPKTPRM